jgi:uncharacterized protein
MLRVLVFLSLLLCLGFSLGAASAAEPTFPALTGRVVDEAHILNASTRSAIEAKLAAFETKTGRQVVVVTLPSLQGYEIEDYGYRLGRQWGIGQKGSNNGALLIVAPNERRVRIEVGYGLEGTLTDAVSRLIIENGILPRFRAGDFAGGIQRGVDDIVQVLSGDAEDFKRRAGAQNRSPAGPQDLGQFAWVAIILGLWLFFAMRSLRQGRRRSAMPWIIPMGGVGSSRGWGGGFSGGGFSGGGGSFGGGGASGRW